MSLQLSANGALSTTLRARPRQSLSSTSFSQIVGLHQSMSSRSASQTAIAVARPSASILLISSQNHVLLLHRVNDSSSFPSAHVFPGGNLSSEQDGDVPHPDSVQRHMDGPAYRMAALRECFEESGILLARERDHMGALLHVDEKTKERGRKDIHKGKVKFETWVKERSGIIDTDGLIPFTRWITPSSISKRYTTQMYIYFLPLKGAGPKVNFLTRDMTQLPTPDCGEEHTTANFASCKTWLDRAARNEIILYPPQFFLMHLLTPFLDVAGVESISTRALQEQRDQVLAFLERQVENDVPWSEKVICPKILFVRQRDRKVILALDDPGPELRNDARRGDTGNVVLVKFEKEGPQDLEVRTRREVMGEERVVSAL